MRTTMAIPLAIALAAAGATAAGEGPSADLIVVRHCVLDYERTSLLGASASGVLQDCSVRPGDAVKAGQVLGHLQDLDARAEADLRAAEASSDVDVRLAEAKYSQAKIRLVTSTSLFRRNALNREELDYQRLDVEVAKLTLEEAGRRRKVADFQHQRAEALLRMRAFVCPHDGIVVEVFKAPGESVALNEPAFRVVDPGRVWVTGQLDVSDAWRPRKGQRVRVAAEVAGAELAVEEESFDGEILFVDPQISATTRTCKVVAAVSNRAGLLRSGLEARLEILPTDPAATPVAPRDRPRPPGPTPPLIGSNTP